MRKSYTSRRAVIAALLTLVMTSCLGEDHLKAEQQSPTGKYKAELIAGDTGAVAGWQSIVRLSELNPSRWTRLLGREKDTFFGVDLRSTHVADRKSTRLNSSHANISYAVFCLKQK